MENRTPKLIEEYYDKELKNAAKEFWKAWGWAIVTFIIGGLCFALGYLTAEWNLVVNLTV